jgi:hypothetical protein
VQVALELKEERKIKGQVRQRSSEGLGLLYGLEGGGGGRDRWGGGDKWRPQWSHYQSDGGGRNAPE